MEIEKQDINSGTQIDVISDVICPWCYIGKHRFEQGLAMLNNENQAELRVRWRPFELNPTMTIEGMDRNVYCERKFGSAERGRQIYANIAANAEADGLPMDVEGISRVPNTRAAHRLIESAENQGQQNAIVNALFEAYFVKGLDIGVPAVLNEIATESGFDQSDLALLRTNTKLDELIEAQERRADVIGVQGVPAFLFNGQLMFTGAQDPKTIALSIERALMKGL